MNFLDERLPARFWDKVVPEPNSGCWLFIGTLVHGYGRFRDGGRIRIAHRVVYEAVRGELLPNLTVDHKCGVTCCQNPQHLEAVSLHENLRRRSRRRLRCPNGHDIPVTEGNHGDCRECARERSRRHYNKHKAAT